MSSSQQQIISDASAEQQDQLYRELREGEKPSVETDEFFPASQGIWMRKVSAQPQKERTGE